MFKWNCKMFYQISTHLKKCYFTFEYHTYIFSLSQAFSSSLYYPRYADFANQGQKARDASNESHSMRLRACHPLAAFSDEPQLQRDAIDTRQLFYTDKKNAKGKILKGKVFIVSWIGMLVLYYAKAWYIIFSS